VPRRSQHLLMELALALQAGRRGTKAA
jgi:hypothetical protein